MTYKYLNALLRTITQLLTLFIFHHRPRGAGRINVTPNTRARDYNSPTTIEKKRTKSLAFQPVKMFACVYTHTLVPYMMILLRRLYPHSPPRRVNREQSHGFFCFIYCY